MAWKNGIAQKRHKAYTLFMVFIHEKILIFRDSIKSKKNVILKFQL